MATIGQRMTADEFLQITDEWPRMELVDGEIVVNTPSKWHQELTLRVAEALRAWVRGAPGRGEALIELDHRLDDANVYAPDVWWSPDGWVAAGPAIAIEVRSPSTWRLDRGVKRERYLAAGTLEVWLVDGDHETVEIAALVLSADDVLTSPLLPGFQLSVRELFRR